MVFHGKRQERKRQICNDVNNLGAKLKTRSVTFTPSVTLEISPIRVIYKAVSDENFISVFCFILCYFILGVWSVEGSVAQVCGPGVSVLRLP